MNKLAFFIDSTDGILKWIPKPIAIPLGKGSFMQNTLTGNIIFLEHSYNQHVAACNKENERAKKEAIEVEYTNTKAICAEILRQVYGVNIKNEDFSVDYTFKPNLGRDKIYTIDMEEDIEKVWIKNPNRKFGMPESIMPRMIKIARIIPKKADKSNIEKLDALTSDKESGGLKKAELKRFGNPSEGEVEYRYQRMTYSKPLVPNAEEWTLHERVKNDDVAMFADDDMLMIYDHFYRKGLEDATKKAEESEDINLQKAAEKYATEQHYIASTIKEAAIKTFIAGANYQRSKTP